MSLKAFQLLLSELVMSPEFRRQLREEPEAVLAPYDLDPRERRRLQAVAADAGVRAGNVIHVSFRFGMLADTLPRTCTVLGTQMLQQVLRAYWRSHRPRDFYFAREAARFGAYLLERLASGELDHPYVEEVLRFELATLELRRPEAGDPPTQPSDERIVRFRHDPRLLLPKLDRKEVPTDLPDGDFAVRIRRLPTGELQTQLLDPAAVSALAGG